MNAYGDIIKRTRHELKYGTQCGRPAIPLLLEPGVKVPLNLSNLQCVDFTGAFGSALAQLRKHITSKGSGGSLPKLKKEFAEAEAAMARAWRPGMRAELRSEIDQLKTEIAFEEVVARDPQGQSIAAARHELNDLFVIIESGVNPGEGICALIEKAIHHGATIYNLGSHIGCAAIYDYAAKLVVRLLVRAARGGGKAVPGCGRQTAASELRCNKSRDSESARVATQACLRQHPGGFRTDHLWFQS